MSAPLIGGCIAAAGGACARGQVRRVCEATVGPRRSAHRRPMPIDTVAEIFQRHMTTLVREATGPPAPCPRDRARPGPAAGDAAPRGRRTFIRRPSGRRCSRHPVVGCTGFDRRHASPSPPRRSRGRHHGHRPDRCRLRGCRRTRPRPPGRPTARRWWRGPRCRPTSSLPGPPSGALATPANGRTGPFPGQVIPGFSGIVDNGDGTFWGDARQRLRRQGQLGRLPAAAVPRDAGLGDRRRRAGEIEVGEFISLRDPDHRIPFPIVNEATPERLLTGGDFDIESVCGPRTARSGSVRSSDRSCSTSTPTGTVLAAADRVPRRQVAAEPVPRARRDAPGAPEPGLRGDGRLAERTTAVPDRRGLVHRRPDRCAAASSTSSTPAAGSVHRPHVAVRDRHRRQRDRRRLHGRPTASCC